jgi:hypothetical protein
MPFTLAHPAAIWVLRRAPHQQLLPLIVGSVAPDLPDFMPGRISQYFELVHTLGGSVLEDVPLGMVVLLALVALRVPLTELLGSRARPFFLDILERFAHAPRSSWLLAPLSMLAGIWTHLLWDSFTHENGWTVRHVAVLRSQVTVLWYTGELCHVLQYASSVLGLGAVLLWYRASVSASGVAAQPGSRAAARAGLQAATPFARSLQRSTLVLVGVLVAAVVIGVAQAAAPAQGQSWYRVFSLLLTRTMAWFGLLYVLAGTVASLRQRMRPSAQG